MAVLEQVATHDESFRTLRRDMRRGVAERAVRFIAASAAPGGRAGHRRPPLRGHRADRHGRPLRLRVAGPRGGLRRGRGRREPDHDSGSRPSAARLDADPVSRRRRVRRGQRARRRTSRATSRSTSVVCWPSAAPAAPGASAWRDGCHGGPATARVPASGWSSVDEEPACARGARDAATSSIVRTACGRDAGRDERGDGVVAAAGRSSSGATHAPRARPRWPGGRRASRSARRPPARADRWHVGQSGELVVVGDGDGDPRVVAVRREDAVRAHLLVARADQLAAGGPRRGRQHAPRQGADPRLDHRALQVGADAVSCAAGTARRSSRCAACSPALGSGSDIGTSVGPPSTGPVAAVTPARASISEP